MFLGFETTTLDFLIGGGLGLVFLGLSFIFMRERNERVYQENLVEVYRDQASSQYEVAERLHATLEGAEIVQNFLMKTVAELVDEVGDLEEDLEEAEEEADDLEEEADDALAGWARADELAETTLAWGTRVVDLLERAEKERL